MRQENFLRAEEGGGGWRMRRLPGVKEMGGREEAAE
jgi:hypothetical protein